MRADEIPLPPGVPPAFREGALAFLANCRLERANSTEPRRVNPYPNDSQDSMDWTDGFFGLGARMLKPLDIPFASEQAWGDMPNS